MFTGLVAQLGRIAAIEDTAGLRRFRVESKFDPSGIALGASIMHSGVCLTVTKFGPAPGGASHEVEAVPETLNRTILGELCEGDYVNLEPSLRLGDELGGHFVFGHVDCVGEVVSVAPEGESRRIRFNAPSHMAKYLAEKGSIAVDGVSLTVAAVGRDNKRDWFEVAVIPHTWDVTTLKACAPGRRVNLEADMLARYVARMIGKDDQ